MKNFLFDFAIARKQDILDELEEYKKELFGDEKSRSEEIKREVKEVEGAKKDENRIIVDILDLIETEMNLVPDLSSHRDAKRFIYNLACKTIWEG